MNSLIQNIEAFFAGMEAWGINLPTFFLVPLIMALAIAGTVVLVKAIQWLICLIFRDKGKKFVKGFTDFTMSVGERTENLVNGKANL